MSDIYIKEHRHNTLGKMSTEILLKDIGSQLAHIADEVREHNNLAKQNNVNNRKSKVCYEDGSVYDISNACAHLEEDTDVTNNDD